MAIIKMADKIKLKDSEALYKSLFDNTIDGLAYCQMIFDARANPVDLMYIRVNKNFEKLTGLKNAEGKKVRELIPGITISNPELFEIYGRVSLTGKSQRFETYVEPLSRWFLISVYSPQKGFFVGVFQNITDRKRIEKDLADAKIAARNVLEDLQVDKEELAHVRAKDEAMLASIGDGVISTDKNGIIQLFNKAAESMLGIKEKDVIGIKFNEVLFMENEKGERISDEDRPINKVLFWETTTTTTGLSYHYVRKDKTKFPAAITVAPIFLNRTIIGSIEVFRDITKERSVDRAKSEFVSLASHQLKTPPTAIKLLMERILNGRVGQFTEKQTEYFNDIRSSNQRMIDLVNTLLSVSRIELGTFTIQPIVKDICTVLSNIVYELTPEIENKHLQLTDACSKEGSMVALDEPLFHMVINNLVMNAINYTPEGGTIRIESRQIDKGQTLGGKLLTENCFLIVIADTGYGIPKNEQSKIFTKFFRADNAREKQADGNGLGLYIVKSILDNCGGLIWFTSEENKGSTFYLAIPLTGMRAKVGTKQLISQKYGRK